MALSFTRDIQEEILFLPSQEAERLRISECSLAGHAPTDRLRHWPAAARRSAAPRNLFVVRPRLLPEHYPVLYFQLPYGLVSHAVNFVPHW